MNEHVKKYGVQYGVIFSVLAIVYAYSAYAIDEDLFTNWWISILITIVGLALMVVASVKTKAAMGGFISFKDAFSSFMVAAIVYVFISTAANMLLFHVIDPDLGPRIQEKIQIMVVEKLENANLSDEQIDESLQRMEEQDSFSVKGQLKGVAFGILFFAVVGAISSLILKKKRPEWETENNSENT